MAATKAAQSSGSFLLRPQKGSRTLGCFLTREEARLASFGNTRLVQKRLNYLSPIEWLDYCTEQIGGSAA